MNGRPHAVGEDAVKVKKHRDDDGNLLQRCTDLPLLQGNQALAASFAAASMA